MSSHTFLISLRCAWSGILFDWLHNQYLECIESSTSVPSLLFVEVTPLSLVSWHGAFLSQKDARPNANFVFGVGLEIIWQGSTSGELAWQFTSALETLVAPSPQISIVQRIPPVSVSAVSRLNTRTNLGANRSTI